MPSLAPAASAIAVVVAHANRRCTLFIRQIDGAEYTQVTLPEPDLGFQQVFADGPFLYAAARRFRNVSGTAADLAGLLCVDARTGTTRLLHPRIAGKYELVDVLGTVGEQNSLLCLVAEFADAQGRQILRGYSVGVLGVDSGELGELHPLASSFG